MLPLKLALPVVYVLIVTRPEIVRAQVSCYSCTQVNNHDGCNVNTEICATTSDVCYTKVEKLDYLGKVYTKGCKNVRICGALESLNLDYVCAGIPSTCFYCCTGPLCNQYNTAPPSGHSKAVISVSVTLVCIILMNMYR